MVDERAELLRSSSERHNILGTRSSFSWSSLYNWTEEKAKGREKELALRYSRYKYGDITEILRFSRELQVFVRALRGQEIQDNAENWVIFTPPYSSVEPAVRSIGVEVAKAFNIPNIDFRAEPTGSRETQYAALPTLEDRLHARLSVQTAISDSVSVEGKNALVIDDLITTGITAEYMNRILSDRYHLSYVIGFLLINLTTENPDFEEEVNRFLIRSGNLEVLISILNDPVTTINRHTLKSLYGKDRDVLGVIAPRLLPSVLDRLEEARYRYFGTVFT